MSFNNIFKNLFFATLFLIFLLPSILLSQEISLTVGNTTGHLGDKLVPLDIKFTNLTDTIAGIQIKFQIDRPDLIKFQQDLLQSNDTTYWQCNQYSGADCIDSTQVFANHSWDFIHVDSTEKFFYLFDTLSYIQPDWFTYTYSTSGLGYEVLLTSYGSTIDSNFILPSPSERLLVRLYLKVTDSLLYPFSDTTAKIYLQNDFIDHFSFSTPSGEAIGRNLVVTPDTSCYVCLQWVNTVCLGGWQRLPLSDGQPIDTSLCDSLLIYNDTVSAFDSTYWQLTNGSFTLTSCGYASGSYDISNLVALVNYMFTGGAELSLAEADYNCDCEIDISDLVGFVAYMFQGGAEPGCTTQ